LYEAPRHQLKIIVEFLGLPTGDYHRALSDSMHVKGVFQKLTELKGLKDWQSLLTMGAVQSFDFDRHAESVKASMPLEVVAIIDSIRLAIDSRQVLSLTYNGVVKTNRTVLPKALIHSRGQYYMNGFCQKVQAERTFRVDRITRVKVSST
ncbi:MAG: WYL domain-containing protein, partial [Candidatus Obscuribacterales bacterium]|nr:WYL domain-containing protein [Candidatus Obscuribacterales bacterium]